MSERLNTSERLIIELLGGQPRGMLGLEMIKASNGKLKRGTIYIWLARLEEQGIVESQYEDPAAVIARHRYRLSRRGKLIEVEDRPGSSDTIPATA